MRRNYDFTLILFVVILAANSLRNGAFSDPLDWLMDVLMTLPAIIIGLSFHEYAHAVVSYKLGDPTPKLQGRVTINPMAHVDPVGFAALIFAGFGWGVPVEVNPTYYANRRKGELLVSLAGVTMNLIIAIVFAVIAKILLMTLGAAVLSTSWGAVLWTMIMYVIQINLVLMIFNLIPVPPLDGFSIICEIFDLKTTDFYWTVYRYGNVILIALIIFGVTGRIISPCVSFIFNLLQSFIIF